MFVRIIKFNDIYYNYNLIIYYIVYVIISSACVCMCVRARAYFLSINILYVVLLYN